MPPKAKVTREDILNASFELVRSQGHEALNVRAIARRLSCSTQPVLYNFATVESLEAAVYEKADAFHTAYILPQRGEGDEALLALGLNYVRFGYEERNLFRFLFQSGYAQENNLMDMIDSGELEPVLSAMRMALGMDMKKTRDVFLTVALFAHGYASIIANNALEYDEALAASHLERAWDGAVFAARKEDKT